MTEWKLVRTADDWDVKQELAEKLLEFMFKEKGWRVIRFGYEQAFPDIKKGINYSNKTPPALMRVRFAPDFFVLHHKNANNNVAFFAEVKYRTVNQLGEFKLDEAKHYKKYWPETIVIVVKNTYPYLLFQSVENLDISKPKQLCKYFDDDGQRWFYQFSKTNISQLLYLFSLQELDTPLRQLLDSFERTPEKYFYSYKTPTYYAYWSKDNEFVRVVTDPSRILF